jgi:exonuclease VII small subunit
MPQPEQDLDYELEDVLKEYREAVERVFHLNTKLRARLNGA